MVPAPLDCRLFASAVAAMHRWRYAPPSDAWRSWKALADHLDALFASEDRCADLLFRARFPDGFRCPACRHRQAYVIRTRRLPLFQCRACRRQTSVTSGTVMERSRTPLIAWCKAVFLLSQPGGISSKRLAPLLGVTYKTAWLIAHKIRHAMRCGKEDRLLGGLVKIRHMHYGYEDYPGAGHPLWFAASVEQDRIVQIRCQQPAPEHINANRNIRPEGLWTFLARHVDRRATVTPPEELKYGKDRWAPVLLKAGREIGWWLAGTFRGIGAKHLQRYLDEFCFRVNVHNRGERVMERLLARCGQTKAITYRELTRERKLLPSPWKQMDLPKNRWQALYLCM